MAKQTGLVYATGTVLYVGSLLEWRLNKKVPTTGKQAVKGLENSLVAKWIAISILLIVLGFTVEQAPEFGKPFAVLILVAGAIRYSKAISITFNETQGSTK